MKSLIVSILFFLNAGCATAPKAHAVVNGIDTFGSKRISATEVSQQYGTKIEKWVLTAKNAQPEYVQLKKEIETSIQDKFGFAYVDLSLITYFQPSPGDYVTVDVVEAEDVAERMAFLPEPKDHFEDPDGLIALWDQYFQTGIELQQQGRFEFPKNCPTWHCVYGFENQKLVPFLEKFNQLIPRNEKKLVRSLKQDARAQFRGNAAFLLAHIKNGQSIVKYALGSVRDPSGMVRNNVVRVLFEIAWKHPEIEIPLEPILQVLKFPATTDRNKAGYTLVYLSQKEKNKKDIIRSAGAILLEMLKLQQPNNHDPAYEILKNVSGERFGERDYVGWENWLSKNSRR